MGRGMHEHQQLFGKAVLLSELLGRTGGELADGFDQCRKIVDGLPKGSCAGDLRFGDRFIDQFDARLSLGSSVTLSAAAGQGAKSPRALTGRPRTSGRSERPAWGPNQLLKVLVGAVAQSKFVGACRLSFLANGFLSTGLPSRRQRGRRQRLGAVSETRYTKRLSARVPEYDPDNRHVAGAGKP